MASIVLQATSVPGVHPDRHARALRADHPNGPLPIDVVLFDLGGA